MQALASTSTSGVRVSRQRYVSSTAEVGVSRVPICEPNAFFLGLFEIRDTRRAVRQFLRRV